MWLLFILLLGDISDTRIEGPILDNIVTRLNNLQTTMENNATERQQLIKSIRENLESNATERRESREERRELGRQIRALPTPILDRLDRLINALWKLFLLGIAVIVTLQFLPYLVRYLKKA